MGILEGFFQTIVGTSVASHLHIKCQHMLLFSLSFRSFHVTMITLELVLMWLAIDKNKKGESNESLFLVSRGCLSYLRSAATPGVLTMS
jgi:hypothetical protein